MKRGRSPRARDQAEISPQAVPSVSNLNPAAGPAAGGNQVIITGAGLTGAISVQFGPNSASFVVVSDNQVNAVAPPGSGTAQVRATTFSGTSNSLPYTYQATAPTLTSLNPGSGPAAGGNGVVLAGTSLTGVTAVHFGPSLAVFTVGSGTQINAVAPPGSGTVAVNVTSPAGTSGSLPYTYVAAPSITSVSPTQGPLTGGNSVAITGGGFTAATAVTFGGVGATTFTVVDSGHMTATAPGGNPPGPVQVAVTTPAGTSNGVSYFYLVPPALAALAPNQGPAGGGNLVILTGTGLTGATAVRFGVAGVTSFMVVSDSQVNAIAPAGAGTVQVTVTTAGGVTTTSAATAYTYLAAPVVNGLLPDHGLTAGGNLVTLNGAGLTFAAQVRFGVVPASFVVLSDNQVVAMAPPAASGSVAVTLTTPGGTSPGVTYTYVAQPGT